MLLKVVRRLSFKALLLKFCIQPMKSFKVLEEQNLYLDEKYSHFCRHVSSFIDNSLSLKIPLLLSYFPVRSFFPVDETLASQYMCF